MRGGITDLSDDELIALVSPILRDVARMILNTDLRALDAQYVAGKFGEASGLDWFEGWELPPQEPRTP